MKKINFTCWTCVKGERWEQEAREGGGGRQWMGGERRRERTGDMRMD